MKNYVRHCKNCQQPIKWVPYLGSGGRGFWIHDPGRRNCALVAVPIPMDDDGIEYMRGSTAWTGEGPWPGDAVLEAWR
jgi:hypothetical protein